MAPPRHPGKPGDDKDDVARSEPLSPDWRRAYDIEPIFRQPVAPPPPPATDDPPDEQPADT